MIEYIQTIIETEQLKLLERIVHKYGEKGGFTKDELVNRFLKNQSLKLVNDKFQKPGPRGRPKKNKE